MITLVQQAIDDPKTAAAVATGTVVTGASKWLDWLPDDDLSKIVMLVGMVLSLVLIVRHGFVGYAQYRKTMLEIRMLEQEARK